MNFDIIPNLEKYPDFKMPSRGTPLAAGLDVFAQEEIQITHDTQLINLGFKAEVPVNHAALLMPRSGNGSKFHVQLANTVGLIDHDYQGDWMVAIHLGGKGLKRELLTQEIVPTPAKLDTETDEKYVLRIGSMAPATQATLVVPKGEAFCQILIVPIAICTPRQVTEFSTVTDRGEGGFGSTDSKTPVEYGSAETTGPATVQSKKIRVVASLEGETSDLPLPTGLQDGDAYIMRSKQSPFEMTLWVYDAATNNYEPYGEVSGSPKFDSSLGFNTDDYASALQRVGTGTLRGTVDDTQDLVGLQADEGDRYIVSNANVEQYILMRNNRGIKTWVNWNKLFLAPATPVETPLVVPATPVTTIDALVQRQGGLRVTANDMERIIGGSKDSLGGLLVEKEPVFSLEELNSKLPRIGGQTWRLVDSETGHTTYATWNDLRAEWIFFDVNQDMKQDGAVVARTTPDANYHADEPWQARPPLSAESQSLGPTGLAVLNRQPGQPLAHVVPMLPDNLPLTMLYPDAPEFINKNNIFVALPNSDFNFKGMLRSEKALPTSAKNGDAYLVMPEQGESAAWVQTGEDGANDWSQVSSLSPSTVQHPIEMVLTTYQLDGSNTIVVTQFGEYTVPLNWKWGVGDKLINVNGQITPVERSAADYLVSFHVVTKIQDHTFFVSDSKGVTLFGPELVEGDRIYVDSHGQCLTRKQAQARIKAGSLVDTKGLLGN